MADALAAQGRERTRLTIGGDAPGYTARLPIRDIDVLYVSPHPDDAVFSAGAAIARDVRERRAVTVVTIFDDTAVDPARRREEDERAIATLGAERVSLGVAEAPARDPRLARPRHLLAPIDEQSPFVNDIAQMLKPLVNRAHAVIAPLGVGEHADHQVAHAACERVTEPRALSFYEDLPYAFAEFSLGRRLARLGGSAPLAPRGSRLEELRAAWRWWSSLPLLDEEIPFRAARPFALAVLARNSARPIATPAKSIEWKSATVDVGNFLDDQLAAIACYATQWPLFFRTLDEWRSALAARVHFRLFRRLLESAP